MTNIQENSNKAEKRILLIGSSGSGKSTLGNVLINRSDNFEKVFDEGDYSISKIKNISEPVKVEIEGINYSIIDTPGFDDTSLEVTKIPPTLTKLDECTKLGVDYILLVVNRRFTSKDLEVSKYLKDIFFEENVVEYITIVFTHFSGFKNKKICEENINKLRNENDSIFNIINNVRIIHVNNPPPPDDEEDSVSSAKRAKENSRKTILDHLKLYQNEEKCKPRSGNLHERVKIFNEKELKDMKQRHIDFGEWVEGINHYIEWRKHMKNDLTNYKIICLCILLIVRLWQSTEDAFLYDTLNSAVRLSPTPLGDLVIRIAGGTVDFGSKFVETIIEKIYLQKISIIFKEDKEQRSMMLKKEIKNQIKEYHELSNRSSTEIIKNLQLKTYFPGLTTAVEKLCTFVEELKTNKNSESNETSKINVAKQDESRVVKGFVAKIIKSEMDLVFSMLQEDDEFLEREQESLQKSYEELEYKMKKLEEKLENENLVFLSKAQIEVPSGQD